MRLCRIERVMRHFLAILTLLCLSTPTKGIGQEVVYLIRHAEKADAPVDPPLTPAGQARAQRWAQMLRSAGIDVVISSDKTRSRQTAGIIAGALDVPLEEVPISETGGLGDLLSFDYEDGVVLIVGHTETIPSILGQLGVSADVALDQSQFDNLFIANPGGALRHLHMP